MEPFLFVLLFVCMARSMHTNDILLVDAAATVKSQLDCTQLCNATSRGLRIQGPAEAQSPS